MAPEVAPEVVPEEAPEQLAAPGQLEAPEQLEAPPPTPAPKRIRKVRLRAPTEAPSPTPPNPDYWRSRLEENRGNQRAAKNERYGTQRMR